jgi:hypothetical protein
MKPDNLLTSDGQFDKRAIMRDRLNADPDKPVLVMARPTAEGIAALYTAITGKSVSAEKLAEYADRLAALEN